MASWLAIGSFVQPPAWVQAVEEPIQVGIYDNSPKVFVDETGEPTGFWPELLSIIAEMEGWTLEYASCEWDDCLDALEAGNLDLMLDVSYIEERESRFDFNREVVMSSWSVVYVRQGDTLNSLIELDGQKLGVLKDGVQYRDLSKRVVRFDIAPDFFQAPSYDVMLRWLNEGKIDAAVINKFTGALAEKRYPIAKTDVLVAPTQVYFAAPDGENADLLRALDENLRTLKADSDSAYYQLLDRWLADEEPLSWEEIRTILLPPVLAVLGAIAIIASWWNRRLRQEIAHRQRTETALTESQSWLQRILSAAEIVCWEADLASEQVQYFGLQTVEGWQSERGQTSTQHIFEHIIHPDDVARVKQAQQQAIATLSDISIEHRVILPGDHIIWVLTVGQTITNEKGVPIQLVGSSIDISDRKRTEQSLIASEEQLRLSLELTNIGTWDWRVGSDVVTWSDNHYHLLGYEPGAIEPTFQVWRNAVYPDDLERVDQAVESALNTQSEYFEEYRVIYPDQSVHWVLGHGRSLQNEYGETVRMLGVILDITQRKQIEEALRHSEATKQQVLEAIPDLLIWMKTDGTCIGVADGGKVHNLFGDQSPIGCNQYDFLPPDIA